MKNRASFVLKIVGASLALASFICFVVACREELCGCCGRLKARLGGACRRESGGGSD